MKNEFAKIFIIDGEQLLVVKDNNDNEEPIIEYILDHSGIRVSMSEGYEESGEEVRDEAFETLTQDSAKGIYDALLNQLLGLMD